MKRLEQLTLIASFIAFCWLAMQVVHELGHAVGAMVTGAEVMGVVLVPWEFSRTALGRNPHPLFTCWAGPVVGSAVPLVALMVARFLKSPGTYLFRFFAGFCLLANGAYLGFGVFSGAADAGDLLRYGARTWQLVLFGLVTAPLGLYLWHGLGPKFGLGEAKGQVNRGAVVVSVILLTVTVAVELIAAACEMCSAQLSEICCSPAGLSGRSARSTVGTMPHRTVAAFVPPLQGLRS